MLTDPSKFPAKTGIDARDEKHPDFPKKITKVLLKPLARKIVEKELWFETITVIMIFLTGCGELIGRRFSTGWFAILLLSLLVVGLRMFKEGKFSHQSSSSTSEVKEEI